MKKGFTLAEVLITLAIIGVVAALTIPAVVQNYRKTQTVTQLKKVYSALANTTNLAIANEGPIKTWEIKDVAGEIRYADFANTYLIPYLQVAKVCGFSTSEDCKFKYIGLNNEDKNTSNYYKFFLKDGTFIAVAAVYGEPETPNTSYANVFIDINGQREPNRWGKDIFYFMYYIGSRWGQSQGKFGPAGDGDGLTTRGGLMSTGHIYNCNKQMRGYYCAALIMKDGWKISDDYPW